MSDAAAPPPEADDSEAEAPSVEELTGRDRDLLAGSGTKLRKRLKEIFDEVWRGVEDQSQRADDQQDYWRCWNCELDSNQYYDGNAQIYVPIIRDAITARATRFPNQLFPSGGHCVEAIGEEADTLVALLDHYIRQARFKTNVVRPLCINGDIEGQLNLYVDWNTVTRQLVSRETHGPIDPATGAEMPGVEIEDIKVEEVEEGCPGFEVLHDADVIVLPATADSIEDALQRGGSVTIVRRWSKAKINAMVDLGAIRKQEAKILTEQMGKVNDATRDVAKGLAEHVGVQKKGKEAVVWETWVMLPLSDAGSYSENGDLRLCRIFFGPGEAALGAKRNPYWNDRCPLLSAPVNKIAGVFKGEPPVAPCVSLQWEANDAANEGADAAAYAAMPIVAADPEQVSGPLVLNLAAMWKVAPNAIKFLEFPDLTPRAITRIEYCIQQIFRTLGVNPSMLPQMSGRPGAKRNQAEVAMEQQVDLLTTAEAVTVLEEAILSPACAWMVDLDYQFRDRDLDLRMFGEMGRQARMEKVAPLQNRAGFTFVWRGGEVARQNAMMVQQGTAFLNVVQQARGELMQEGYEVRIAPLFEAAARNIFGPTLAGKLILDRRHELTIAPNEENQMLADGFEVMVHPLDNDPQHIQSHMLYLQQHGDPSGLLRIHLQAQLKQAGAKQRAAVMQQMQQAMAQQGIVPQGPPGQPGPSRPGMPGPRPGTPQPGAVPAGPRQLKGPPGMIHPDRMPRAGAVIPPRRF